MLHRVFLSALLFAVAGSAADDRKTGSCDQVFTVPFPAGRSLNVDLRSGDIEIFGTPEAEIRVACRLDDPNAAPDVRLRFERGNLLTIDGGPRQGVHFKIYVPAKTNLNVDCSAGNLTLTDIDGDKDLSLRAGNLTVKGARAADYSQLDASVTAGNVTARGFGGEKSGLFRSVKKSNSSGKYRMKAHVSAGNIEIR